MHTRVHRYLECFSCERNAPIIIMLISSAYCCYIGRPLCLRYCCCYLFAILLRHLGHPHKLKHKQNIHADLSRCTRTNLRVVLRTWSAAAADFVFLNESVLGAVAFVWFLIKEPREPLALLFASCRHQLRLRLGLRFHMRRRLWQVGRSLLSLLIDCSVLSWLGWVSNNLGFNYVCCRCCCVFYLFFFFI